MIKKLKLMMMLALCFWAVAACGQKNGATFIVDIAPMKTDSMWVDLGNGETKFIKAGKDGKYVLNIADGLPKPVVIGIDQPKKGQLYLFMENGNKLSVKTDFDQKSTFSGNGAENARVLNEYMLAYINTYKKMDARGKSPKEFYEMSNSVEQIPLKMLEANKQKVTPAFYNYQSVALTYQMLSQVIVAPYIYSLGFGKKMSEIIPDGYWELDSKVKMNDELLYIETYKGFMTGSYPIFLAWREMYKYGKFDSTSTPSQEQKEAFRYKMIEKYYPAGKIRSVALNAAIERVFTNAKDISTVKPLIDEYIAKYASATEAKDIQAKLAKIASLSAGKEPPFFTLKDINGKDVTLKDFAGKVVYMDFWASWCTPCRYEMKNGSPKLHEKFKDNDNVVFLYISVDSKVEPWKKAIADDKIEGIHLLSLGGNSSPVAKAFGITGVPRYIIIGKDGKIFDNDAPRPSEDITPERINQALSK